MHIDTLDSLKVFLRDIEHVLARNVDARVGNRLIDSSELTDNRFNARLYLRLVAYFDTPTAHLTPKFAQLTQRGLVFLGLVAPNDNRGSVHGKPAGHPQTNAAVATGHEGDLPGKVEQSAFHRYGLPLK